MTKARCPVCGSTDLELFQRGNQIVVGCHADHGDEWYSWECGWEGMISEAEVLQIVTRRGASAHKKKRHVFQQRAAVFARYGEPRYSESFVRLRMDSGDRLKIRNLNAILKKKVLDT